MENLEKLVGKEVFETHIKPKLQADKKYFFGEGEFVPKTRFDDINNKLKETTSNYDAKEKEYGELKKQFAGHEDVVKKLNELTESNKKQKEEFEAKLDKQEYDFEFDKALSVANAKDVNVLKALLDMNKITYDKASKKFAGLQEQIDEKKKTHDYVFNIVQNPAPNKIGSQIGNGFQNNNTQVPQTQTNQKSWNRFNRS